MHTSETNKTEENWLSVILLILVIVAVSLFTSIAYNKFKPSPLITHQESPQVLVLSLNDWISQIPDGASSDEIDHQFQEARAAAQVAVSQGYIVLHENSTFLFPDAARLKPGLFDTNVGDKP